MIDVQKKLEQLHEDMVRGTREAKRDQAAYDANSDSFLSGCKQGAAGTSTMYAVRISALITEIEQNESN